MAGEWKRTSLREAGVSLIDCDHRTPTAADSGYPYIAIPQLKEGRINLSDVRRISPEHFADWTRKAKPQHHDVILSRRCNPGETAYVPAGLECALGQNLVLLRADGSKVFPPFLRWLVRGPDWWEQIGTFINVGAIFNSLKCADIPNFRMPLPPLAEQKAIAGVLGALDDKIELNRRMNATLEAMAQAMFQSWFVDFDARRPKSASFVDSPLDKIPKGWTIQPISGEVEAVFDGPHATPPEAESGAVYLGIKNFTGTHLDFSDIRHISEAAWPQWTRRVIPRSGDIAFTYEATLGFFALIPPSLRCCLGRRTALVRPKESSGNTHFLFHYFVSAPFQEFLRSRVHPGSTVDRILLTDFPSYPVLVPPIELVQQFEEFAKPVWARIHRNSEESRTLATLRDTLLPKLLSGEITPAPTT